MPQSTLRRVGGSLMIAIPPAILDQLHLDAGSNLAVEVEQDHVVLRPQRKRYTVEELLSQCDFTIPMSEEDREWLDAPAVGRELL